MGRRATDEVIGPACGQQRRWTNLGGMRSRRKNVRLGTKAHGRRRPDRRRKAPAGAELAAGRDGQKRRRRPESRAQAWGAEVSDEGRASGSREGAVALNPSPSGV